MTAADWDEMLAGKVEWLRRVVRRHLPGSDAEDVVQEVLAAAVTQNPDSGRGPRGDVDRWLRGLALNKIRQLRRGEGRRRKREQAVAAHTPETGSRPEETPLARLLRAERDGLLRAALDGMESDDVKLLRWKYVNGWGYDHIAGKLGITRDAVAHRLRAARRRFRDAATRLLPPEDE